MKASYLVREGELLLLSWNNKSLYSKISLHFGFNWRRRRRRVRERFRFLPERAISSFRSLAGWKYCLARGGRIFGSLPFSFILSATTVVPPNLDCFCKQFDIIVIVIVINIIIWQIFTKINLLVLSDETFALLPNRIHHNVTYLPPWNSFAF